MFTRKQLGVWLLTLLVAIPAVWWFVSFPVASRFPDVWTGISTFGKAFAIVGFVLFSLNFVLAMRVHWLETLFGSMDRVYRIHHITGGLAFIFLMFHPLLLAISIMPFSPKLAVEFLFLPGAWPVLMGKLALLTLFVILAITFYAYSSLGHDRWKQVHKFIGVALAFGVVHALFVPGDVSGMAGVKYYLFVIGLAGVGAFLYRTVFQLFKLGEYRYEVVSVVDRGMAVSEVTLKPLGKKMIYLPGQFAFIRMVSGSYDRKSHPFTISSSPTEDTIRFSIKAVGDYTADIKNLAVGTVCKIEGAFGRFTYSHATQKKQIWIAGGIGITPFLSMARFFRDQQSTLGYDIEMYYSGKSWEELVFLKELQDIAQSLKTGLTIHPIDASKDGYLTGDRIGQQIADMKDRDMFVCGPQGMMDAMCEQLCTLGLPAAQVHKEEFALR